MFLPPSEAPFPPIPHILQISILGYPRILLKYSGVLPELWRLESRNCISQTPLQLEFWNHIKVSVGKK